MPRPDLIPGYRLKSRLGAGGMGEVFLAHQESLDRLVALKLLPPNLGADKDYVERFFKEARSAAKVTHENIVGAVDVGEAAGRYYFVMEHVQGETLHRIIKRENVLPEPRALDLARQVARGLRHAHRSGLVHRDIKPMNVMITAEGQAKILDFGLARDVSLADKADEGETVHSTPAFASPEQCRGEAMDHRADIYSLGVSLYEMLTGRRPFQADSARQVMTKQVTQAPVAPQSVNRKISRAANDLVLRMMRKRTEDRFQTYDELIKAIDGALGGKREAAISAPPRKPPIALIAGGAAAAVVLIVVLVLAMGGDPEPPQPPAPEKPKTPTAALPGAEAMDALEEVRTLEEAARKDPSRYLVLFNRLKELQEAHRGTLNHALFTEALQKARDRFEKRGGVVADELMADARQHEASGRHARALESLRLFPESFARTAAGVKVAARILEIERAIDSRFRQELDAARALLEARKFEAARARLQGLVVSVKLDGGTVLPRFRSPIDELMERIQVAETLARAGTTDPAPGVPAALPKRIFIGPSITKPDGAVDPPDKILTHYAVVRSAEKRADPLDRRAAARHFRMVSGKSAIYAAAAEFLRRDEASWNLEGAAAKALDEYLQGYVVPFAQLIAVEDHQKVFGLLTEQVAAHGDGPSSAFQLFACAHLHEIVDAKGEVDAAVALQGRLSRSPIFGRWGPSGLARVELAAMLDRPRGILKLTRAGEKAASSEDFDTRFLGALCLVRNTFFNPASAAAGWEALATDAPDAGWKSFCLAIAGRVSAMTKCESCDGKGKYSCIECLGKGSVDCPDCSGGACKTCGNRRRLICTGCEGKKFPDCSVCEGKKKRRRVPGSSMRYLSEVAACPDCSGRGSVLPDGAALFGCSTCEGTGRLMENVPAEFAKLPGWVASTGGRSLFLSLRWLARHQAKDGRWSAGSWEKACPQKGCSGAGAGAFDVGLTGMTVLAFLKAGFGSGSDVELGGVRAGKSVRRALIWLAAQQTVEGQLKPVDVPESPGYNVDPGLQHLISTHALCLAVSSLETNNGGFTDEEIGTLRDAALGGVHYAVLHQKPNEGWGYTPESPTDTWITAWGALALLAAKEAGIEVPQRNLEWIIKWYDTVTDRKTFQVSYTAGSPLVIGSTRSDGFLIHDTLGASGGLIRALYGNRSSKPVLVSRKNLRINPPATVGKRCDYTYWHFGTRFLAHVTKKRGTDWKAWTQALIREQLTLQDAADTCALGSWSKADRWSSGGGKIYTTALNALTMQELAITTVAKRR